MYARLRVVSFGDDRQPAPAIYASSRPTAMTRIENPTADPAEVATAHADLAMEQALVVRAQAGDTAALAHLLTIHANQLYAHVLLPRTGNAIVAKDLLRETLAHAAEKFATFRWQGVSVYAWLRTLALRRLIDQHRAQTRQTRLQAALAHDHAATLEPVASPHALLSAAQDRALLATQIQTTLAQLHPRYQQVITMRLVDNQSRQSCASALNLSVATFDVLLYRAIRAFRTAYQATHGEAP